MVSIPSLFELTEARFKCVQLPVTANRTSYGPGPTSVAAARALADKAIAVRAFFSRCFFSVRGLLCDFVLTSFFYSLVSEQKEREWFRQRADGALMTQLVHFEREAYAAAWDLELFHDSVVR